jgi:actin-related protein
LDEYDKGNQVTLQYPLARGLLHDSDAQSTIWTDYFSKLKKFDASISSLSLTMAPVIPDIVQKRLSELVFEDLGFDALC